jgi:hypothetical protein
MAISSYASAERKWTAPVGISAVYYENVGSFNVVFELEEVPTFLDASTFSACNGKTLMVNNGYSDYTAKLGLDHSSGLTALATGMKLSFLIDLSNCNSDFGWDIDGVRIEPQ